MPDGKSYTLVKPNVILTGMPGAGKSTVGVILAKEFGYSFLDTDILIQQSEGMMLQEIIDTHGLEHFLTIEERYVTELRTCNTIIAPGGSVVLSASCMSCLRERGIVVFLDVPLPIIRTRINEYTRGIVKRPGFTIEDVWIQREPLYRSTADITLDCRHMSQMETAALIAEELRRNWRC